MSNEKGVQEKKAMMKKAGTAIGLIAIVAVIVGAVAMMKPDASDVKDKTPNPAIGPADAKVVVKEYADFQCPACAGVAPVVKDLEATYPQVRFEYNYFPLSSHKYGNDSALAGVCADQQGKFFEYHDTLYDEQKTWSKAPDQEAAQEYFLTYAQDLGMNMAQFDDCATDQKTADRVTEDMKEGATLNVDRTPTFFVNGERVIETPFSSSLKKAIDEALVDTQ